MKITHIEAVPYYPPLIKFFGRHVKMGFGELKTLEFGLVRVSTDEGIAGLGEISIVFAPTGVELSRIAADVIAPHVIGANPFEIAAIHARMDEAIEGAEPAKAAIDIAVYDIVGKALDVPVYTLLGGRVREAIPLSHSIMFGSPEEMAELAGELKGRGFRTVKVKVGQDVDEAAVRAIRETVGDDFTIRVDANAAWRTPKEALDTLNRIEPYRIELAEQPLAADDLDGMAFVRDHSAIPVMADESVWGPRSAMLGGATRRRRHRQRLCLGGRRPVSCRADLRPV